MLKLLMKKIENGWRFGWLPVVSISLISIMALTACDIGTPEPAEARAEAKPEAGAEATSIPAALQKFVPAGWHVEIARLNEDLDRDTFLDAVMVLVKVGSPIPKKKGRDVGARTLLVLMGEPDGTYRKTATAEKLLICAPCGGMMGAGFVYVDFEDHVLLVAWSEGSRWAKDIELRFSYNKDVKRMVLVSDEVEDVDRIAGESSIVKTRHNYVTGIKTVKTIKGKKKTSIKKKIIFIDDVNEGDYGFSGN